MFGASNEMPAGSELGALWDRLVFRHQVAPLVQTSSFVKMLQAKVDPNPDIVLTIDDIYAAHEEVDAVELPKDIFQALKSLRETLRKDEGQEATDRRWMECIPVIRAEAWMNGRSVADIEDIRPLMHILWDDPNDRKMVRSYVLSLANPIDKEAGDIIDRIVDLERELEEALRNNDNTGQIATEAVQVFNKAKKAKAKITTLEAQAKESGRKSELIPEAKEAFKRIAVTLHKNGFGIKDSEVAE